MQPRLDFPPNPGLTPGVQLAPARICERLPLGALRSNDARLATILAWWEEARIGRRWPSWSQLDIGAVNQLADRIIALQVISLRSFRYSYVEFITSAESDDPLAVALDLQTRDELQSVASLGAPRFDRIQATFEDATLSTRRLMLPLSRDCDAVSQILICRTDC